jgi:sterol desaturase/sphingolipid hydroxylase (fatty acid hydroxylase superfamily)
MLVILSFILLFFLGHITGCLLFYFTHRFIFHGKLGTLPLLKRIRKIHTLHHAKPHLLERAFFPLWAKVVISAIMVIVGIINLPLALGVCSFFPVYAYRHWMAHNGTEAYWAKHHMHHHLKDPSSNFGGIYPIVDTIFRTNVNPIKN